MEYLSDDDGRPSPTGGSDDESRFAKANERDALASLSSLAFDPKAKQPKPKPQYIISTGFFGKKPNYKNPKEFSVIDSAAQTEYFGGTYY